MASQKAETFVEYLRRLGHDYEDSEYEFTADDYFEAANAIALQHSVLRNLVKSYHGPTTPQYEAACKVLRSKVKGKRLF